MGAWLDLSLQLDLYQFGVAGGYFHSLINDSLPTSGVDNVFVLDRMPQGIFYFGDAEDIAVLS